MKDVKTLGRNDAVRDIITLECTDCKTTELFDHEEQEETDGAGRVQEILQTLRQAHAAQGNAVGRQDRGMSGLRSPRHRRLTYRIPVIHVTRWFDYVSSSIG